MSRRIRKQREADKQRRDDNLRRLLEEEMASIRGPSEPGCPGMTIEQYEEYIASKEQCLAILRAELAELRARVNHRMQEAN